MFSSFMKINGRVIDPTCVQIAEGQFYALKNIVLLDSAGEHFIPKNAEFERLPGDFVREYIPLIDDKLGRIKR